MRFDCGILNENVRFSTRHCARASVCSSVQSFRLPLPTSAHCRPEATPWAIAGQRPPDTVRRLLIHYSGKRAIRAFEIYSPGLSVIVALSVPAVIGWR